MAKHHEEKKGTTKRRSPISAFFQQAVGKSYLFGINRYEKDLGFAVKNFFDIASENTEPLSPWAFRTLKKIVDLELNVHEKKTDEPLTSDAIFAINSLADCYKNGFGTEVNHGIAKELYAKTGFLEVACSNENSEYKNEEEEDSSSSATYSNIRRIGFD